MPAPEVFWTTRLRSSPTQEGSVLRDLADVAMLRAAMLRSSPTPQGRCCLVPDPGDQVAFLGVAILTDP